MHMLSLFVGPRVQKIELYKALFTIYIWGVVDIIAQFPSASYYDMEVYCRFSQQVRLPLNIINIFFFKHSYFLLPRVLIYVKLYYYVAQNGAIVHPWCLLRPSLPSPSSSYQMQLFRYVPL